MNNNLKMKITREEIEKDLELNNYSDEVFNKYFTANEINLFQFGYQLRDNIFIKDFKAEENIDFLTIKRSGFSINPFIEWINKIIKRKRLIEYKKNKEGKIRIVSEGDSWFQHPFLYDIIDNLNDYFAVYSLEGAADTITKMFKEKEYSEPIKSEEPKCFLLSAGGNDILGKMENYLINYYDVKNKDKPEEFLNANFFKKIDDVIKLYTQIFKEVREISALKIIVHGYDYLLPGKENKIKTKWNKYIGTFMDKQGIIIDADKKMIIKYIIDTFNEKLKELVKKFSNIVYIDLRNCVGNDQWNDEIHPDDLGFQIVSLKFIEEIKKS